MCHLTQDADVPTVVKCETLDDLLAPIIEAGQLVAWCRKHHISRSSLNRARHGLVKPTRGFAMTLSVALGVGLKRVLAALEAPRGK